MERLFCTWALGMAMAGLGWGEENSAQRLENAQKGMAEANWPKKPDNRLSPLSGKMKDAPQISPKFYGKDKEFRVRPLQEWNKDSRLASVAGWQGGGGKAWDQARWNQGREWSEASRKNPTFQFGQESANPETLSFRNLGQPRAPDWAARASRLANQEDGGVRPYDGRLRRVREQVWQEEKDARDLGSGRQEKFSPQEVEKLLSQPPGELRDEAKARSPAASPLAAADN